MVVLTSPAPNGWKGRGFVGSGPKRHSGIDFGFEYADSTSRDVVAAANGTVVDVYTGGGYNLGFGNRVVIDHGGAFGLRTTYNHFASVAVREGQEVERGQYLGRMGDTGKSDGIHLHFEAQLHGVRVDPEPYFGTPPTTAPAAGGTAPIKREPDPEVDMSTLFLKSPLPTGGHRYFVLEKGLLHHCRTLDDAKLARHLHWRMTGENPDFVEINDGDLMFALQRYSVGALIEHHSRGVRLNVGRLPRPGGNFTQDALWKWASEVTPTKQVPNGLLTGGR